MQHCDRTAIGFRSRIALGLLARAHSPPSAAALERRPALSCSTSIATSGCARSTRLPRRRSLTTGPACATRWCLGEPARSGRTQRASAQTPLLAALAPRLMSLEAKASRHRGPRDAAAAAEATHHWTSAAGASAPRPRSTRVSATCATSASCASGIPTTARSTSSTTTCCSGRPRPAAHSPKKVRPSAARGARTARTSARTTSPSVTSRPSAREGARRTTPVAHARRPNKCARSEAACKASRPKP